MMIEIPVHNDKGDAVDKLELDEQLLGGEVRPALLKQAYVRFHANRRQGSASNRSRGELSYSTVKLYRQKGTGNARRGARGSNITMGGGVTFAKKPRTYRQRMPKKMRRLANRNALLAKAVDGEIKLLDKIQFGKPSTKQFSQLLASLQIDRSVLVALSSTQGHEARSAKNLDNVTLTHIDRLNAFDLLNHHYVIAEKDALAAWVEKREENK